MAAPTESTLRVNVERAYAHGERHFAQADWAGAEMPGATLDDLGLEEAKLNGARLCHASLQRTNLRRADVSGADFSAANLKQADLSMSVGSSTRFDGAVLENARLTEAKFSGASFREAHLRGADARDSVLSSADFAHSRADSATFHGANLHDARFEHSKLSGANFQNANLRNANFEGADLSDADFNGAQIDGAVFARACLDGVRADELRAKLRDDFELVKDQAMRARLPALTLVGACAYVLVTAASTTDARLALNRARVNLPLVNVELPLQTFFVGAAVLIFLISGYMQLHQQRLIRSLSKLPCTLPDGARSTERLPSSLIVLAMSSCMLQAQEPSAAPSWRDNHPITLLSWIGDFERVVRVAGLASIWGLAPLTVALLLWRFMSSQRSSESYAIWLSLVACTVVSVASAARISATARGRKRWPSVALAFLAAVALLAFMPGVLRGIHSFRVVAPHERLSDISSAQVVGANLERAPLQNAVLRFARLDQALLWGAQLQGADLTAANLSGANAQLASLERAELAFADLTRVRFAKANLTKSVLTRANLSGADLRWAALSNVLAAHADFSDALADEARFDAADLSGARLVRLRARGAVFEGANLEGAELASASLQRANLRGSRLAGADLSSADLTAADLTGCLELTLEQLCKTLGWSTALLPGDQAEARSRRVTEPGQLRKAAFEQCGESAQQSTSPASRLP